MNIDNANAPTYCNTAPPTHTPQASIQPQIHRSACVSKSNEPNLLLHQCGSYFLGCKNCQEYVYEVWGFKVKISQYYCHYRVEQFLGIS
jgi:hypothetical protein